MARPSVPLLSKELIRDTALALIDAHGLDGLTMRGLAQALGVRAQSLYAHYPNKDALLDAVANLLTWQVDTSGFAGGDWRTGLRGWARSYRAALVSHPNAAPIVAAGTGDREDFLAMADAVHGGLISAGWPARTATLISGSVKYLVIGSVTTGFGQGFADDTRVYVDRYPHLVQAHLIRHQAAQIDEESFELALDCLIDGLAKRYPAAG